MSHRTRTWGTAVVAIILAAAGLLVVGPAQAARLPGCVASELHLVRGSSEAATGHRYDRFRITNVGERTCRLYGYPTFRFRNAAGDRIGYASVPAGVPAHVVRLAPGDHTRITVGTVGPGVTVASECRARHAASVDIRLAYRAHVYHRAISLQVCTTKKYRPTSYPVGF
jgi:hypothetical protein